MIAARCPRKQEVRARGAFAARPVSAPMARSLGSTCPISSTQKQKKAVRETRMPAPPDRVSHTAASPSLLPHPGKNKPIQFFGLQTNYVMKDFPYSIFLPVLFRRSPPSPLAPFPPAPDPPPSPRPTFACLPCLLPPAASAPRPLHRFDDLLIALPMFRHPFVSENLW